MSKPAHRNTRTLRRFSTTDPARPFNSCAAINELVDAINSLLSAEIVFGNSNEIIPGRSKVIFQIASQKIAAGTGNLRFRGEYDPAVAYQKNDLVVISSGVNMGTYVCLTSAPGPTNPPGVGNNFWISLFPSLGQFM